MDKDIKIILAKYFIIVTLTILYIAIMLAFVGPAINHAAFGQSAFDVPNQFNQQPYQDPYQSQYGMQQPYQQQYGGYDQYNQYQQPYQYQQYGTPTYSPYGMQQQYPQQYPQNTVLGFGIQEIVTALIAGGGATAYARRRTNSLENDKQLIMAEMMRDKQKLAELARVSYEKMPNKGNEITDAPAVRLQTLNDDIDKFTEKVSKA